MEDKLDNYDDYDTLDDSKSATDLSENLLAEGLEHRKIRNVEEKIDISTSRVKIINDNPTLITLV